MAKGDAPRRPSASSEECDSKRISFVSLYRPKFAGASSSPSSPPSSSPSSYLKSGPRRVKFYHLVFLALYVYQAGWVLSTVGVPYRQFLEKADREGFQVMEGTNKMRAELEHALFDINDPDRPPEKLGWFDWMDMDIEEHNAMKKREKEKSVLDSLPKSMRVPGKYAPSFVPCLVTGLLITLHLLVVLMQHWSVGFNVWINYKEIPASVVEVPEEMSDPDTYASDGDGGGGPSAGGGGKGGGTMSLGEKILYRAERAPVPSNLPTHARITLPTGKEVLVPLMYLPTLGMTFEYHRRRYAYSDESRTWNKIRCSTTMPTDFFRNWSGFASSDQVTASHIRFGKNVFDVRQPTFKELYKAQLLSPFTVFQLFCVVLWMLDDYWQYSAFTLFMILMFEGTVVFARLKSLQALTGMGNKARAVLVYRMGRWREADSFDLLPGDVVSVTRHKPPSRLPDSKDDKDKKKAKASGGAGEEGCDVVPADVLLLRGSCVVNEASLTGESVPQMKEGLNEFSVDNHLAMKGAHKGYVLYAGTRLLQCKGVREVEREEESSDEEGEEPGEGADDGRPYGSIPPPPDGGAMCFVLRTGFSSAQGKLVRMIEGSQEKVKGHERDTALLLLLLFLFAVASSSYVLYHGLRDENRSHYELLLHCVLIVTSVIPPELPMQMALTVNKSLMTLMKMQVFCTEPYRVPMAGKLDICLFDKTGTLTTDELVAVGVLRAADLKVGVTGGLKGGESLITNGNGSAADKKKLGKDSVNDPLTPMTKLMDESALVLAGCHSLVLVDGETTGDPLESAALGAMRWGLDDPSGRVVPLPATEKKSGGTAISVGGCAVKELEVTARHHFSSKLQRMSCVVRDVAHRLHYAVVKGSPEAVANLLVVKPPGYDERAKALAKSGYRVIALAYKPLSGSDAVRSAEASRATCEDALTFAGFIAFTCRVRKDTKEVLKRLKQGGMSVAMVTGDALLTAAHVAREVAICHTGEDNDVGGKGVVADDPIASVTNPELRAFLESKRSGGTIGSASAKKEKMKGGEPWPILILEKDSLGMIWRNYEDESKVCDFVPSSVEELAARYDLATTGKNLAAAFEFDDGTRRVLQHFKIFARMTPDAKETVIECLHSVGLLCLMCGDGANDVGALKQADVGVALLGGFGDVNVDRGEDGNDKKKKKDSGVAAVIPPATAILSQPQLDALRAMPVPLLKMQVRAFGCDPDKYGIVEKEDMIRLYQIKAREIAVTKHAKKSAVNKVKTSKTESQAKQRAAMAEKQQKMQARIKELEAQGEQWASVKVMKEFWANEVVEGKKKKLIMEKNRSIEGSAANMLGQLEDLETDELPMVKIGDASIAAPFTSKMPSIRSCVDIIRQGRCTLVTSIQMVSPSCAIICAHLSS